MFSTSIDLMYGVISISILVFTGFLVWIMYYVAQILKQGNEVIADVRQKLVELEESINEMKTKIMTSATSITFIASEVKNVVEFIKGRQDKKNSDDSESKK